MYTGGSSKLGVLITLELPRSLPRWPALYRKKLVPWSLRDFWQVFCFPVSLQESVLVLLLLWHDELRTLRGQFDAKVLFSNWFLICQSRKPGANCWKEGTGGGLPGPRRRKQTQGRRGVSAMPWRDKNTVTMWGLGATITDRWPRMFGRGWLGLTTEV